MEHSQAHAATTDYDDNQSNSDWCSSDEDQGADGHIYVDDPFKHWRQRTEAFRTA